MTVKGEITLEFSNPMYVPEDFKNINGKGITSRRL